LSNGFESSVRQDGVFGAVFEADGETAYFYLLDTKSGDHHSIVDAYDVTPRLAGGAAHVAVRWSSDGGLAGLFADDQLVSVFDVGSVSNERTSLGRTARAEDIGRFG